MEPLLTMSTPVRMWVNMELSLMGRAPNRNPNTPRSSTTADSTVTRIRTGAVCQGAYSLQWTTESVVHCSEFGRGGALERLAEADDGGADDHHEEGGHDAEHHRDEHLHGRLLGLLLGVLP